MYRWFFIGGILVALTLLVLRELSLMPDGRFHVYVFDVGQGDSILLVSPSGKQVLIDGGEDTKILEYLGTHMPFFDRTIELLVLTHPDADHVTGLPDVIERYAVARVLFPGTEHSSGPYDRFLSEVATRNVPVIRPDPAVDIDVGDGLILDIIWPSPEVFGTEPKNTNNLSMVLRARFGEDTILLTGDIEEEAESKILMSGADIRSDILKVPHHGSRTSSSTGFLLAIDPDLAVISSGDKSEYGHPHEEVLARFESLGIPVRITNWEGTISLVLDGK